MAVRLSDLRMPSPQQVFAADGTHLATYSWGELDAPTVMMVHGFASSTYDTWVITGWIRPLLDAGFRVIGIDQRGHGASDKPYDADAYNVRILASDIETVLDTYLVDEALYLGYSLGGRIGWQVALDIPERIERAVLGGIPDGVPLDRLDLAQGHAYLEHGTPVTDQQTLNYITLAERTRGNDLGALLALAEGMRDASQTPDAGPAPHLPILFATGTEDGIIEGSRAMADAAPSGTMLEIPGRHHFNAVSSREFQAAAVAFLRGE